MLHEFIRLSGLAIILLAIGAFLYPIYQKGQETYQTRRKDGATRQEATRDLLAYLKNLLK
jgi:hypothetical protein